MNSIKRLSFFSALKELMPSQLVLFAQSFGIPVNSMRYELTDAVCLKSGFEIIWETE